VLVIRSRPRPFATNRRDARPRIQNPLLSNHPNEQITAARNPNNWKPGRPYLDRIKYTIIKDVSTRLLAFIAGQHDVYFGVTVPQLKDVKAQAPEAICEVNIPHVPRNMLVNPKVAPFDNPELRRAMSLSLDRKAFNDTSTRGRARSAVPCSPCPTGFGHAAGDAGDTARL
jgi:peptide/nickel transport system substrate-binding protein